MASNYSVQGVTDVNFVVDLATLPTAATKNGSNGTVQTYPHEKFAEFWVAMYINNYAIWVICVMGWLFNTAAVVTIFKLKPFTTSSLYIILLAFFDTLTLTAKLTYLQFTLNNVDMGDAGCKLLSFIGSFLDQFSVWIVVLLTIERFVAVWLPLKVSSWFTMSKAKLIVGITVGCLMAIDSSLLFTIHQSESPPPVNRECGPYQEYIPFMFSAWYWIESCLTAIIPCVILIVLNSLIIYGMRKSMERQKEMTSGMDKTASTKHSHKTHLTVMLVTVSVSCTVLLIPLAIFNVMRHSLGGSVSPHGVAKSYLVREITHMMADCNHGLNFVFYFLSSRRFRAMFYRIVKFDCREQRQTGYSRATGTSYSKTLNSTTNTYYMQVSVRGNGGV